MYTQEQIKYFKHCIKYGNCSERDLQIAFSYLVI